MTFHTTRWTVVRAAGGASPEERRAALEVLCRAYWKPVQTFVVKRGATPERAEDLTQPSFARLLESAIPAASRPEPRALPQFSPGRAAALLANEHDREQTEKRGAGARSPRWTRRASGNPPTRRRPSASSSAPGRARSWSAPSSA
jgi:RNA polymerase sigma-70 factor (ECF subfamily)